MLLWVHPLMKLFVLIVSPSVSFLFEITISERKIVTRSQRFNWYIRFSPKTSMILLYHKIVINYH
jgi:hypothetical protein